MVGLILGERRAVHTLPHLMTMMLLSTNTVISYIILALDALFIQGILSYF